MESCSKLENVYLNIYILEHLEIVDFSDCGALTKVYLSGDPSDIASSSSSLLTFHFPRVEFKFTNCFNLDQEALLRQHQGVFIEHMILPGEEVPSYFTYRTIGTSMSIPLHYAQQIFNFRACVVVEYESLLIGRPSFDIQLCYQFKDRFENILDIFSQPDRVFPNHLKDSHLLVFDRYIHLNEDYSSLVEQYYDQVDIKILITNTSEKCTFKLKGWGISVFEECSSPGNPNTFSDFCESVEDDMGNDGYCEIEVEIETNGKGMSKNVEQSTKSFVCIQDLRLKFSFGIILLLLFYWIIL